MWRCLWKVAIPFLMGASILLLFFLFFADDDERFFVLDQEKHQYDQALLQQATKLIHSQVLDSRQNDIERRSKFQRAQVRKFCASSDKELYTFKETPQQRSQLHRHLLFDDHRRTIFCFVEKAGCTNMKRLMFVSAGQLPPSTAQDEWVDLKLLEKGIRRASFLNKSLTEQERLHRLREYYKFTVVRNPLERLVSSYKDKIEPPLVGYSLKFPDSIKMQIFEHHRPVVYHYWQNSGANYNISIPFSEFVEYYIESFKDSLNSHIKPFTKICHPCNIPFDFYLHFNNYSQDLKMVVDKVGFNWSHYHDKSLYSTPNTNTASIMGKYYQTLSRMQKARLYDVLQEELLLYYHLFPSERESHKKLLGIEEELYGYQAITATIMA